MGVSFTDTIEYENTITGESRFPERIETDRLIFRGPIADHATLGEFHDFHGGDIAAKLADPNDFERCETVEDTAEILEYMMEHWKAGDAAYYLMYERERSEGYDTEFCGVGSVEFDWETKSAEIGVWLHPAVWGNRYASERAEALLEVVFNSPVGDGIDVVNVAPKATNEQSIRSVSRYVDELGGRRVGRIENGHMFHGDDEPADYILFQIARRDYRD